jgi:hypothetical protein
MEKIMRIEKILEDKNGRAILYNGTIIGKKIAYVRFVIIGLILLDCLIHLKMHISYSVGYEISDTVIGIGFYWLVVWMIVTGVIHLNYDESAKRMEANKSFRLHGSLKQRLKNEYILRYFSYVMTFLLIVKTLFLLLILFK